LQSIFLLSAASEVFATKCISGVSANRDKCAAYIEKSLALATLLVPHIGYDKAAVIAKKAHEAGKTVLEIARQEGILPEDVLKQIFQDQIKEG